MNNSYKNLKSMNILNTNTNSDVNVDQTMKYGYDHLQ